jgi:DNA polymerase-1
MFTNTALFAFSANELPTIGEGSEAYFERIKPFKFDHSFAGREDRTVEDRLQGELPGILLRLVTAWQRWNDRGGYQKTNENIRIGFEQSSDRVRQFVAECCVITPVDGPDRTLPEDQTVTKRDIARAFNEWAAINHGHSMASRKIIDRVLSIPGIYECRQAGDKRRAISATVVAKTEWGAERAEYPVEGLNQDPGGKSGSFAPTPTYIHSPLIEVTCSNGVSTERESYMYVGGSGSETATSATVADDLSTLVIDLETCSSEQLFQRPGFIRLYGSQNGSHPTQSDAFLKEISESGSMIIGHNVLGFDLPALSYHHGLDLRSLSGRVADTEIMVRLDDPPLAGKDGRSAQVKGYYGLDTTCQRRGVPGKTHDLKALAKQYGGYDRIPTDDQTYRAYLAGDLTATRALYASLPALNAYAVREMEVALIMAQMSVQGFRVDVERLPVILAEQDRRKEDHIAELAEIAGVPLGRWTEYKRKPPIWTDHLNPLATLAGKDAIIATLTRCGIPERHLPRTPKSGQLALSGDDMRELAEKIKKSSRLKDRDLALRVVTLIGELTGERTIYKTVQDHLAGDRVHPLISARQASGRWSVTNPGLTVLGKRGGRHVEREIFLPEPGHKIIAVDLDQVDARAVAGHSGDEAYLAIFRQGRDLHAEVAKTVFGDAGMREAAKAISHGWNYGEGINRLVSNGIDRDLAVRFDERMREQYPDLVRWQETVREEARSGELLDNGFGRKMRPDPARSHTQGPALAGQGGTRDILAHGLLRLAGRAGDILPMLRVVVHDEVVLSVPESDAEEISRTVVDAMTFDLAEATGGALASVPITAGCSVPADTWAGAYEKGPGA